MPHFQENEGWGHWTAPPPPLPPSVVLRWDFLKLCPLKNILKLCSGTFYICFCLEIHRHPLGNLALRFLHEI